jgi:hypothetical protein
VFADPDGGYCARFFNRHRGDVVLNPFEPHSVRSSRMLTTSNSSRRG